MEYEHHHHPLHLLRPLHCLCHHHHLFLHHHPSPHLHLHHPLHLLHSRYYLHPLRLLHPLHPLLDPLEPEYRILLVVFLLKYSNNKFKSKVVFIDIFDNEYRIIFGSILAVFASTVRIGMFLLI